MTVQTDSIPNIRIIVPIATAGFRDQTSIDLLASPGIEVSFEHLSSGPVSIESAVDEVLSGPGIISAAVAAEADGCDAIVIDCMLDPALDAVREAVSIPVIAPGETTMSIAAEGNKGFSIVTVLDRQDRLFRLKARTYALEQAVRSVRSIDVPVLALDKDTDATLKRTIAESIIAIEEDGAESIIFGCTGMLGLGEPLQDALRQAGHAATVQDPLLVAVRAAEQAVRSQSTHSKLDHPFPQRKGFKGMHEWPGLKALLSDTTL